MQIENLSREGVEVIRDVGDFKDLSREEVSSELRGKLKLASEGGCVRT